jgi:glycosyltransferase involved in cell wall biosynthesis
VTSPLRVFHLIHDLGPGGAEHVLVDLASVAGGVGIDLTVVSMLPTDGLRYPVLLRAAGARVVSLDLRAWWDPRGPGRLRRLVSAERPDVLHSHLKHADFIAGRVARRTGIPHVSTLHVIEREVSGIDALKRRIAAGARRRTAIVTVAVSDAMRRCYLEDSGEAPDRVVTIHNGVPDPGQLLEGTRAAVRTELGIAPDAIVAAMVAVMRPGKGHEVLLAAARSTGDVVFLLVGDGPLESRLRSLAADLPAGRVVFTGFREDVDRILAAADLVVHPSFADALPTALIHAIAAGLPVVASDVGGVSEIVRPGAGLLVSPGDPGALASAVAALSSDADERHAMGKLGRERYDEEFGAERWAGRLRALYERVVG